MISHILAPTDFSESAYNAVKAAIIFAEDVNAEVTILHTYEVPSSTGMLMSLEHVIHGDAKKEMEGLMNRLKDEGLNLRLVKTQLLRDDVAVGVTKYSTRHNVDLIMIGNKGETNLNTLFLGSNAKNVIKYAKIPVWIISSDNAMEQTKVILFALDNDDILGNIQTFPLIQIAQTYNSKVRFVHVLRKGQKKMTEVSIPESFSGIATDFMEIEGDNPVKTIDTYADNNDINFTCLVYKKRSWLESLTQGTSINTKQFAEEDMNVLILKEVQ